MGNEPNYIVVLVIGVVAAIGLYGVWQTDRTIDRPKQPKQINKSKPGNGRGDPSTP